MFLHEHDVGTTLILAEKNSIEVHVITSGSDIRVYSSRVGKECTALDHVFSEKGLAKLMIELGVSWNDRKKILERLK